MRGVELAAAAAVHRARSRSPGAPHPGPVPLMAPLLALAILLTSAPSTQTLVYYNARMALREARPTEALKLWLLRNAVGHATGQVSGHDADLRSVAWAALGELGLCPDGFARDDAGAGLWPLALHNWVIANRRRAPAGLGTNPFDAFATGRQARFVGLGDVLDAEELKRVRFARTECGAGGRALGAAGLSSSASLREPAVASRVLRHLLRQGLATTEGQPVRGRAAIEARLFDLNLRLTALAERAAARARRQARREARRGGASEAELDEAFGEGPPAIPPDSEAGKILRASLGWTPDAWMALSPQRRQFLFSYAARLDAPAPQRQALILGVIDRLIDARAGAEVESWIAHLGPDEAVREAVWSGERGQRLLTLDDDTGFRGRAAIALRRGVDALSAGRRAEAIRTMGQALRWADDAREPEAVRSLTLRWVSYVASRFRFTDALFEMLRAVAPRGDFALVLEDQLWTAAFNGDAASFDLALSHQRGRGALLRRAALLRPLAEGRGDAFLAGLAQAQAEEPTFAQRFLRTFLDRLRAQDAAVRARNLPVLRRLLEAERARLAAAEGQRVATRLEDTVDQLEAIIAGLTGQPDATTGAVDPSREVFVGSLRVAPSDDLPWPFRVAEVTAPPVFTALNLRPVEWRDAAGSLVFGWEVTD